MQVLQGTWKELAVQAASLGNKRLTLVIPGDEEQVIQQGVKQPEEVKTKERLEELLLQGLASPSREMTEADWDELLQRAEGQVKGKRG